MPQEVVTIQIGQCGNQIGYKYWQQLQAEHGLDAANEVTDKENLKSPDRRDIFFYQSDDNKYIPRAVLIDLEPRVINYIKNASDITFNSESVFVEEGGGGAGNNWGSGFTQGEANSDKLMDILDREADGCDRLEAFQLLHSTAGGTGSGLGSYMLETIADRYPKTLLSTYSIFPTMNDDTSDVVVQPYNSLLALKRLSREADAVTVLDNGALNRIAVERLRLGDASVDQTNGLVATAMAAASCPSRFPGYAYNDVMSIYASLIPTPVCHFLSTGFTPLTSSRLTANAVVRKTTVMDIVRTLLQPSNMMASIPLKSGSFISCMHVIRGDYIEPHEVHKALQRVTERGLASFVPWSPSSLQISMSKQSPYITTSHKVSGLSLCNHTSVKHLFGQVLRQYDKLMKRHAFLDQYRQHSMFSDGLDEFYEAQEVARDCIDEYTLSESIDYVTQLTE